MSRALFFLGVVATVVVVTATCQGIPDGATCDDIPDGGCPTDRGGSCADPTCSAIYLCNNGLWSLGQICPPYDAGSGGGGVGGSATVPEAGPLCSHDGGGTCTPVVIDAGNTADPSTCTPDLMCGDCTVSAAYGCKECACTTGCDDFYICTPLGWVSVAYCDQNGNLIISNE
jgi:hypothetical protein